MRMKVEFVEVLGDGIELRKSLNIKNIKRLDDESCMCVLERIEKMMMEER